MGQAIETIPGKSEACLLLPFKDNVRMDPGGGAAAYRQGHVQVTDMEKAGKYLDKHDADYVLIKKDLYLQSLNKRE